MVRHGHAHRDYSTASLLSPPLSLFLFFLFSFFEYDLLLNMATKAPFPKILFHPTSQVMFIDTSVPPLQSSWQETGLDTHHIFRVWSSFSINVTGTWYMRKYVVHILMSINVTTVGCWHEYRTFAWNSGQWATARCKKSTYEENSARP